MDRNGSEEPPRYVLPDSALPDSAMASDSDDGEPGEHLGPADLRPDEQRLLHELERDAVDVPAEDRGLVADDLVAEAVEDETPLPAEGGDKGDGLSPRFSSPDEE
jgi:hypothetical protein